VNRLKAELAIKQVDIETKRQRRQNSEEVLSAQVAESEKQKDDVLAALREASEKSKGLKKDFEGIQVLLIFLSSSLSVGFLTCIFL
jgi:fructose-specific phosphotransferase system component IIB